MLIIFIMTKYLCLNVQHVHYTHCVINCHCVPTVRYDYDNNYGIYFITFIVLILLIITYDYHVYLIYCVYLAMFIMVVMLFLFIPCYKLRKMFYIIFIILNAF